MNSNYHFKTISIKELVENQLPEKKYLVDKLIPDEGYCILGGRSKGGKSWLLLLLCLSVSQGGVFLGKKCSKVGSLYIALEDSQRRIKERINQLLDFEPPEKRIVPDGLDFIFDFPKLNKGGYEFLDNYLSVNKEKKLIVIDTIRKITSRGRQANDYDSEYSDGGLLQKLALKHNCLIISAAHTRKTPSENSVFDEIAGSVGFIAAADILLVLKRGKSMSKLHITGRDIEDIELLLNFHNGLWSSLGKEEDVKCSTINIEWEKIIIPEITRKELVGLLMSSYQIGQSLAYRVISEAITNGEIFLNGKYIQTN